MNWYDDDLYDDFDILPESDDFFEDDNDDLVALYWDQSVYGVNEASPAELSVELPEKEDVTVSAEPVDAWTLEILDKAIENMKNSGSLPYNVTVNIEILKKLKELVESGKPLPKEEPDWFKTGFTQHIDFAQVEMKIAALEGLDTKSFGGVYEKPLVIEPWIVPDWD